MGEVVGKGHHWPEGQNHSPPKKLQSPQATRCWAFRLCKARVVGPAGVLGPASGPCTRHGSSGWRTSGAAEPSPWPKEVLKRRWKSKRKSDALGGQAAENRKHRGDSQGNEFKAGKGKKMNKRAHGVSVL